MDKSYQPSHWEPLIRSKWEKDNPFEAKVDQSKDPFCIILPPPNANGALHAGHVMMVYQDIMCRFARTQGKSVLYLPGMDHAGFETQYVFEKQLAKQDKSRFDYDRETLYSMIAEFVAQSKGNITKQFNSVGFSLDWSKEQYTLNPNVIEIVYQTFKKLFDAGLVYRSQRLVNYCTKDGTSFSDLEIKHVERIDKLYYMKYGPFILATTRPETKFGDTAVAVHPKDKRYKEWVGKEITFEGLNGMVTLQVVADEAVDPEFGTGVVKVTPAHDMTDAEIAKRHNLPSKQIIGFDGKLTDLTGPYAGLRVKAAREKIVADLLERGLIDHIDEQYTHTVGTCYKCGNTLEPLPLEQWYVSVKPLADRAKDMIKKDMIEIHPKRFNKILIRILDDFIDWNISRQIVWGIRIPAYKCTNHETQNAKHKTQNLQTDKLKIENCPARQDPALRDKLDNSSRWFVSLEKPEKCEICGECTPEQDTDTFDTWFSSGQWPFATLMSAASTKYNVQSTELYRAITNYKPTSLQAPPLSCALDFFNYFYPTTVMETGYDIARAWVARMIMLGAFVTGKPPFKHVYLHGMVRDGKGQKMSKSKGNVIDPLKLTEKYGTDALRLALVFGTTGGNDVSLSDEKVIGMRNFVNKVWNIGRFIQMLKLPQSPDASLVIIDPKKTKSPLNELTKEFKKVQKRHTTLMKKFEFSAALVELHEFMWHRFADYHIEQLKDAAKSHDKKVQDALSSIYLDCLSMLAPYAPFVTEAILQVFTEKSES